MITSNSSYSAIKNPNVSEEAKHDVEERLNEMQ
jgi:hypothetical protein